MLEPCWKPRLAIPSLGCQGRRWAPTICPLSCSLLRRGSVGLFGFCILAEKSRTTLLVVETVSSLHEVRLQPGCPGMELGSAEPLSSLGTCWPVNSCLLPPRKPFRLNPWHFSAVFPTSVQPSTSLLGSSAQICPFLPNPTTGWLILHLLPASGWSHIHIRDNHVQWTCSIRDRKQRRAGTCQESLMRWFYLSIDLLSATHGVWHFLSGSCCWGGTQLRWLQHGATFQKYPSPSALHHPSPTTAKGSPEPHCYRRMKGISWSYFSISEVWIFEMNLEAWQLVFCTTINLLKINIMVNSDEGGFLS